MACETAEVKEKMESLLASFRREKLKGRKTVGTGKGRQEDEEEIEETDISAVVGPEIDTLELQQKAQKKLMILHKRESYLLGIKSQYQKSRKQYLK
ncbi:unnamed protein product [Callosobruchus maculatus]|uniref:Uncharacterized protein n=1 Tax=Callosobruchus maculatus TaxID=64391 RepID=A0A653DC11_CALMS|nr:unnamed protein product [Callosobruchus maculatus]